MTTQRDYYDILGVERGATDADIKKRVPQARPAVAPGRQPGRRRRRALQGDQRGLPGPLRSRSAARPTTCSGGPASAARRLRPGRPAPASAASPTSSTPSSAGAPAAGRGPARPARGRLRPSLRPADHLRGVHPRARRRRSSSRVLDRCEHLLGQRREERAPRPQTCPQCGGRGEIRHARQTMLGQMVNVVACPRCRGEGKVVDSPVRRLQRRGPHGSARRRLRVAVPAGHRRRPPDPPLVRGRGRAPRRSAGQPLRRHPRGRPPAPAARGDRALPRARPLDRPGCARHHGSRPDGRRRGGARGQARHPARHGDPPPRPGRAAPAPRRRARRPPRARRRRRSPRSSRRSSARRSRPTPRPPARRTSAPARAASSTGSRTPWAERRAGRRRAGRARRATAPGSSWPSPATPRPSRRSARSWPGSPRAGRASSRGSTLVDEGLAPRVDPARPGHVRAYLPARDARGRPAARSTRSTGRSATSRPSGCGRSASCGRRSSTRPTGRRPGSATSRSCAIGRRIVIRPTWRRHRRQPGDVVIAMDPGMAFGTGLHPTTRLCLAGIERWADEGLLGDRRRRVGGRPDRARGSSTSAAARGSSPSPPACSAPRGLVGVDTDPIAVEATRANARRNRVARRAPGAAGLAARPASRPVRPRRSPT